MIPQRVIVMCRNAELLLLTGFVRGFQCADCGRGLQVSPQGRKQITEGVGEPLCNPCAMKAMKAGLSGTRRPYWLLLRSW